MKPACCNRSSNWGKSVDRGRSATAYRCRPSSGKNLRHFANLSVDAITCDAHKFHGPLGIGLLIVRRDVALEPLLFGGFQQGDSTRDRNSALVAGLLKASKFFTARRPNELDEADGTARQLKSRIVTEVAPTRRPRPRRSRFPQTSNIAFSGSIGRLMLMALDQAGVACSTGKACASGSSEPSPTLTRHGGPAGEIESSLRFSLGTTTTPAEIAAAD